MHGSLSLNGTWQLTWAEGSQLMPAEHFTGLTAPGVTFLPAQVPAPIHQVLMRAGMLDDPNIGLNSLKARWVEEQFWIYRHTFTVPQTAAEQTAWLVFEKLEYAATIYLNGEEIGNHANTHRPARFNVTGRLQVGENLLVVKLESGLHDAVDKSAQDYTTAPLDMLTKRHWHRKPQYQSGWDWNPRLINVGILGDVRLEWSASPRLDQVTVFAVPTADLTAAAVRVRATVEGISETPATATLQAVIRETGQSIVAPVEIQPGENRHEVTLTIEHPRLWWPIHHGEQYRYTVDVSLQHDDTTQVVTRKTGVRRVEMDQSPHPETGRYCILKINNRPIFCKGGNWVPADLLYSTVTPERMQELVDLSLEANFNLLRIWGGGEFAGHALCEACDEAGLLIWHDFLFACSKYPGDHPGFTAEVRKEVTIAVRELAHHPSLVVWCGNNEIEQGDWSWSYDNQHRTHPHYSLFHHDLPKIVLEEDPSTLEWISSPWSPDYKDPNDPTCGDQHPWRVSLNDHGPDWWHYRTYVDRFPNEGGVLGMSSPATLRQFLPESEQYIGSPSWDHHDNPFARLAAVPGELGRCYQSVALWTGRNPLDMSWENYAFTSALLQAEGLREYIANYRRRMFSSASAIFWMYNDSWPVTHGWTIIDYYRRKKLAYHPVRRAFAPVSVVVTEEDGLVTVYGVNDLPTPWTGEVRYGIFRLQGGLPFDETAEVTLAANASTPLAQFSVEQWRQYGLAESGAFALLSQQGQQVAQYRLFLERFKDLVFVEPTITLSQADGSLTLTADAFAWGVCLDVDGELPLADNCFDLLPGIPYTLPWDATLGEPHIVALGNRDAVVPQMGAVS